MDLLLLEKTLLALFAAILGAIFVSKYAQAFQAPTGTHSVRRNLSSPHGPTQPRRRIITGSRERCPPYTRRGVRIANTKRRVRYIHGKRTRHGVHRLRRALAEDAADNDGAVFHQQGGSQQYRYGWELRPRLWIMFDRRFESEDDPLFLKLKALNGERSRLAQSFEYNYGDFIPILRPFLRGYLKLCKEVKEKRLQLFKDHFVDERKKIGSTKSMDNNQLKCAIDHILEAKEKGEINEDNVLYIVENINVAAIETTLWSIEWGIAELVNHPEIQSKLRNELDTKLGPGVQVTEPDLQNLPYLQAVIKETLRLRMAIPLLVPHMNLHEAKLGGYDIPAESKILVNAWWLANNPDQWKKPEEFRPERFFEEESKVEANGNDFRYLPFGVGRRSCPGIILALPILGITIGRLVQNFELLPPPGQSKVDTSEKGGQFSLHILKHSTIVAKPRSFGASPLGLKLNRSQGCRGHAVVLGRGFLCATMLAAAGEWGGRRQERHDRLE
ncbi:hypothetical protein E3N88_35639 [Mikania micrantha]|uniref:trans-cinnamate 4-monooxygenase n=1 Tax=Mikania micrantha TaxID=192012 RepID=A0A5N6M1H7_9ASTR|nr:hypothetical protein E3N88_35639 [Mikania micrantha]